MPTESFLDVARALLEDPDAKAAFGDDPDGFLADRGFDGLSADDVIDAVDYVSEALPPGVAGQMTAGAGPDGDPLGHLARLEPLSIAEARAETLEDEAATEGGTDAIGTQDGGDEPFALLDAQIPDPGFGVGYTNDDVDDLAAPEVHEGELPVGFELPVDEAGFVDPEPGLLDPEAQSEHEPPIHGDPGDHDHDPADDGHDDSGPHDLGI